MITDCFTFLNFWNVHSLSKIMISQFHVTEYGRVSFVPWSWPLQFSYMSSIVKHKRTSPIHICYLFLLKESEDLGYQVRNMPKCHLSLGLRYNSWKWRGCMRMVSNGFLSPTLYQQAANLWALLRNWVTLTALA